MKNIYIFTEYISLNGNTTAYYWAKICKYLENSYRVFVVCPKNEQTNEFFLTSEAKPLFVTSPKFDKNNLISRLFGQLIYAVKMNYILFKNVGKDEIVFSGTNPILSLIFLSLFKNIKWCLLCHDVFPNNLIASNILKNGLIYKTIEKIFKKIYKRCDKIIVIGRDMHKLLVSKGCKDEEVCYIPNWASTDEVSCESKEKNIIINELGWTDKIVFTFFGNIGRLQGVQSLVDSISFSKNENSRFLFIGNGANSCVVNKAASIDPRIHYYGELHHEKKNLGLTSCDVSIVSLKAGMYGLGVPSKAYFSLASNRPLLIIADRGSELDLLSREYDIGWFCEPDSPESLGLLIDKITIELQDNKDSFNTRTILEENFSESVALKKIKQVLESI